MSMSRAGPGAGLGAAMAAAMFALPAAAGHGVIVAPVTQSSAISGLGSVQVTNMTVDWITAGPGSTVSYDPLSMAKSGVQASSADSFAGLFFGGSASARADLTTGRLKGSVAAYGPNVFGNHQGTISMLLGDTLHFTNSTGGDVLLTLRYSFNGSIIDSNGNATPYGYARLSLFCDAFYCANESGVQVRHAGTGGAVFGDITADMREGGIYAFGSNIGAATLFDRFDVWQSAPYGAGNLSDGWMQSRLLIPAGTTSLGFTAWLYLNCMGGSNCDFGHTGTLGFVGGIPAGLSIGSASGLFLTGGGGGGGGAIPEPATWALLIAGFGLVGATARRRRTALAQA